MSGVVKWIQTVGPGSAFLAAFLTAVVILVAVQEALS